MNKVATRISKMFGVRLVKPSADVAKSAEKMLDTEQEYISFLRNKKKFFFMTQVQQTRVQVARKGAAKKAKEYEKNFRKGKGLPLRLLSKFFNKKNPIIKFARDRKAQMIKLGRSIGRSKIGRGIKNLKGRIQTGTQNFVRGAKDKLGKKLTGVKTGVKEGLGKARRGIGNAFNFLRKKGGDGVNLIKRSGGTAIDFIRRKGGEGLQIARRGIQSASDSVAAKAFKKWLSNPAIQKKLAKLSLKSTGRMVPIASAGLAATDVNHYARKGDWLKVLLATVDAGASGAEAAYASGVGAPIGGVASIIANAAGWGLTALEFIDILRGKDPFAADYKNKKQEGGGDSPIPMGRPAERLPELGGSTYPEQLADGGQVSSPTQALIAEGGEPEFVVPQSKLGAVYTNLLKQTGSILAGVTAGFLNSLPVPSSAAEGIRGEVAALEQVFGTKTQVPAVFKGSKIGKLVSGLKKGLKAAGKFISKLPGAGMVGGVANAMLGGPAQAAPQLSGTTSETTSSSSSTVQVAGDTSTTMVSGYPITDFYGPSDWRPRPHGGVDVGTPVGTDVSFTVPGEVLYAGKAGGYGNLMDVWLPSQKIQMRIAHLSKFVKKSGEFAAGELLAKTGGQKGDPGAGSSTGPHLHFEADTKKDSVRYGGSGNPLPYAHLLSLGQASTTTTEAGGPSFVSYGHPISETVKWPSSNGSMGGPSLTPNAKPGTTVVGKQVSLIPIPMVVPQPQRVVVPIPVKSKKQSAQGINPFSGRYGVM